MPPISLAARRSLKSKTDSLMLTLDGLRAEPDNTTKSVLAPQMRCIICS